MMIQIQITNKNGENVFLAKAPDIDSAIAELGTFERTMQKCIYCSEPTNEHDYCSQECALQHNISLNENIDNETNPF
jgi:hypothetical protein